MKASSPVNDLCMHRVGPSYWRVTLSVSTLCLHVSASRQDRLPHGFFFFQAEDGIRDLYVTGVQTCALPISAARCTVTRIPSSTLPSLLTAPGQRALALTARSEERRVGKECRAGWLTYHQTKKGQDECAYCVVDESFISGQRLVHASRGSVLLASHLVCLHALSACVSLKAGQVAPWVFFFSSRRRHTRSLRDWSSDVCSSDLSRALHGHTDTIVDVAISPDGAWAASAGADG